MVNAGTFYYNDNTGLMVTLLYNIIGKRIVAVGRPSPNEWEDIPNIFEMPRNVLDLAVSKKIGKNLELKGSVKDILNENVRMIQTINTTVDMSEFNGNGDTDLKYFKREQVTKTFNPGRNFTLSMTYKF
jgi:outer membrane receptor protein involved in Fe transport